MNLVKHGPGNSLFLKCFRYCWLIVRRFDVLNTFLIYYHALAICYVKSNTIFSKQSNSFIFNIIYFFRMGNIVRRFEQDRIFVTLKNWSTVWILLLSNYFVPEQLLNVFSKKNCLKTSHCMLRTQKVRGKRKIHCVIFRNCWHWNQNERNSEKNQMDSCTKKTKSYWKITSFI